MAGYTSRILLTLTVPSIFGLLSVLWFLRKRNYSTKSSKKSIELEVTTENCPNQYQCCSPMKLKNQEGSTSDGQVHSEMQLKETQTVSERQSYNCNGISHQVASLKGKNLLKAKHENGNTCIEPVINGCVIDNIHLIKEDSTVELTNGINGICLTKEGPVADKCTFQLIKQSCADMETRNGVTNFIKNDTTGSFVLDALIPDLKKDQDAVVSSSAFGLQEDQDAVVSSLSDLQKDQDTIVSSSLFALQKDLDAVVSRSQSDQQKDQDIVVSSSQSDLQKNQDTVVSSSQSDIENISLDCVEPDAAKEQCDIDIQQLPINSSYLTIDSDCLTIESDCVTESTNESCCIKGVLTDDHENFPDDGYVVAETSVDMLESPGATKYCDSVGSIDSGKGASEIQFALEPQLYYMVYEFEILPEDCGRLIGKTGRHVHYVKKQTNADILIKRHPYLDAKKLCSVTGTETEINAALKLIRKRFPIERFPSVTLAQINILPFELQCPETLKLSLPDGVAFEAMLCATVNAGHFFLQQPTHPTFHSLLPLTSAMTGLYSQVETPTIEQPSKGNVCAASLASGWFRAEVNEYIKETDECKLKFLDYGGYAVVPRTSVRQIKYDYMLVPFQATECFLGSVTFAGDKGWSKEATALFEELAQGQILQGCIVGYMENRIPCLHLYKITGATSVFINEELVRAGLAKWTVPVQ